MFCVGKNYLDHVKEIDNKTNLSSKDASSVAKATSTEYPQFFSKVPETVVGPGQGVLSHRGLTRWLDYEVELAVIIGKEGRLDIWLQHMPSVFLVF